MIYESMQKYPLLCDVGHVYAGRPTLDCLFSLVGTYAMEYGITQWCQHIHIHIDNSSCWHFIWLPTYHVDKMSDWQFITQIDVTATMDQIYLITHISQSASLINDEGGNLNKNLYNRNSRTSVLDASILSCYTSTLNRWLLMITHDTTWR